jgi:hypothetical protein
LNPHVVLSSSTRHPELVSGSRVLPGRGEEVKHGGQAQLPLATSVGAAAWTLKQVQGDESGLVAATQRLLGISLEGSVG